MAAGRPERQRRAEPGNAGADHQNGFIHPSLRCDPNLGWAHPRGRKILAFDQLA
jgi:hypothetical protein